MTRIQFGKGERVLGPVPSLQKSHFHPEVFTNHTSKGNTVISKKVIALCATVGVAMSGFALAVPAHADPVAESYSIVGSDTLEDVVGALIQGTSITGSPVRSLVNNAASGSFDASGTPYIIAKTSGKRFGRPNGSSDGRKALLASINGTSFTATEQLYPNLLTGGTAKMAVAPAATIPGEVDLSRSSASGTVAADSGAMLQIPFGRDALGYVYDSASTFVGIDNLTAANLKTIFEGGVVTDTNGVTLKGATPQTGSGTGKDWPSMIGSTVLAVTTAADNKTNGNYYSQEHDASALGINTIQPMSASRWIAMHTGGSYAKYKSTTVMGSIAGVSPVIDTAGVLTPNSAFYNNTVDGRTFGRDTYIVVQYLRVTSGNGLYDANLADLVDPTKSTSLTNTSTASAAKAGSVKLKFGFLPPLSTTSVRISG